MREDSRDPQDTMRRLREALARHRELELEAGDLERRRDEALKQLLEIERQSLPDLFAEAGVDRVDLPAEGNLPAVEASLENFYRASVPASWPPQRKDHAFRALEHLGLEDLIKSTVTVQLGKREFSKAHYVAKQLQQMGLAPQLAMSVHHGSLTSAVKELCEEGKKPSPEELEAIGAAVGKFVRVRFR